MYLMWTQCHCCINYLDDVIGVFTPPPPSSAHNAFSTLMNLLDALGIPINLKNIEKPQTKITCLRIDIDTKNGILTIPDHKMPKKMCIMYTMETKSLCNKKSIT